jgi:glycosyltransferase involved in cell wall biosynthesis
VRILLVNAHGADLAFGGAERYVADLRDGLVRHGDDPVVLSAFPTAADRSAQRHVLHATDWREDHVRRLRNHAEDWVAPVRRDLTARMRALAPDIVHTSNLFGITTGIWESARRLGIPVVHTLHDYALRCPRTTLLRRDGAPCRPHPLLCGLRTRRLARWAPDVHTVIGVSAHVLDAHADLFAAPTRRAVVLPPLVATRRAGGPLPAPGDRLRTLGFTGALGAHKGVAMLLSAAPRLAEAGIRLRIAGGGELQEAVAASPAVEYAGRLVGDDVATFIGGCDAGVVPSLWEEPGLTFAALEWLGAGRPTLATARGGLAELPGGGVRRLTGDAGDLVARAIELGDPATFGRLRASVPAVDADLDLTRWTAAHRELYADAAGGVRAAA